MARSYYPFSSYSSSMVYRNVIFFRYLQIIHFFRKDNTLLSIYATSPVEKALSLQISKKHISVFYKTLTVSFYSILTSLPTKQAWERDLGIFIDEADWQEVWTCAMDISTCNRAKSIQLKMCAPYAYNTCS